MDKMQRLFMLRNLFDGRRSTITLSNLAERMECSPATAKRAIRTLREVLARLAPGLLGEALAPLARRIASGRCSIKVS